MNEKILVIDDEPDIRNLVKEILDDEGYIVETAKDAGEAIEIRNSFQPDLVLLDIWMPEMDGIALLKQWEKHDQLNLPIIMMSGHGTVETAVEAIKLGAYDFVEKPLSLAKLLLTVRHGLEKVRLQTENIRLRHQQGYIELPIGESPVMHQIYSHMDRIANHDTPILIIGEPGTEKETFARYVYKNGKRATGPFISVNISALSSDNALEALYGSEIDGSIHKGLIENADQGILFLKDIADLELPIQARLQDTLENNVITRIGGKQTVSINVRFIFASSQNLEMLVKQGSFRDDLYYQLNILPLKIPALREHRNDIPVLMDFFIDHFAEDQGLPQRKFTNAASNYLRSYDWPGNIRELKNLVQRLLILGTKETIDIEELQFTLGAQPIRVVDKDYNANFELPLRQAREQFEKSYLEYKLERANGSVSKVAADVGMERTHLYRKLKSLGIEINPD
jgi:two-component system nitrogen regulation response regulator NtrX